MWDLLNLEFLRDLPDATVYFFIAVVGTLLFLVRLVLMFFGAGHDGDLPVGGLGGATAADHPDSDAAFTLFSLQSILAFFMGLGWMGLCARVEWKLSPLPTLGLASGFGLLMAVLSAAMTFYSRKLASDPRTCVGTTGKVYLPVPAKGGGEGQVEVTISGRRKILPAASTGPAIAAFTVVTIVGVDDGQRLLVEPRG